MAHQFKRFSLRHAARHRRAYGAPGGAKKIAEIVHYLDVGGIEPPEAIGIEKVIQGIRSQISDDDHLFALSNHIFDGLYANLSRE